MPTRGQPYLLSREAEADIQSILEFTLAQFGTKQFSAYRALLAQAFTTLAENPHRPGTKLRPQLGIGVKTFHLSQLAQRRRSASHLIVYSIDKNGHVNIARILHDSMELARHMPTGMPE